VAEATAYEQLSGPELPGFFVSPRNIDPFFARNQEIELRKSAPGLSRLRGEFIKLLTSKDTIYQSVNASVTTTPTTIRAAQISPKTQGFIYAQTQNP
jgi:hypothetical protein